MGEWFDESGFASHGPPEGLPEDFQENIPEHPADGVPEGAASSSREVGAYDTGNLWADAERCAERAHEYYQSGQWQRACDALTQALAIHPDQAEWRFGLGLTLEAMDRFEEAVGRTRGSSICAVRAERRCCN